MACHVHGFAVVAPHDAYSGLDRDPWEHLGVAYWKRALPDQIYADFDAARTASSPFLWYPTFTTDLTAAIRMLAWEQAHRAGAEIIAFNAPYFDELGLDTVPAPDFELIGFDVQGLGETSLIREMLDQGQGVGVSLNAGGLLDSAETAPQVIARFKAALSGGPLASHGVAEDLPIQTIAIYRRLSRVASSVGTLPTTSTKS